MSTLYDNLVSESSRFNETRDCTVIALAVVTGESYATCWKAMKLIAGRRPRRGGHMYGNLERLLEPFGLQPETIWEKRPRCRGFLLMTARERLSSHQSYLLFTARHVAAMTNGIIHDWASSRRLPVRAVVKVTAK